jgi:hypothetical protein
VSESEAHEAKLLCELYAALIKARAEFLPVKKDAINEHFQRRYAQLDAYIEASATALDKHGLAVLQRTEIRDGGMVLVTDIVHTNGARVNAGEWPITPTQQTPQGFGSALTYARRYSYQTALGMTAEAEDDDGTAASAKGAPAKQAPKPRPQAPAPTPSPGSPVPSVPHDSIPETCPHCGKGGDTVKAFHQRGEVVCLPDKGGCGRRVAVIKKAS